FFSLLLLFFSPYSVPHRHLPSFPTRRSSDLACCRSSKKRSRVLATSLAHSEPAGVNSPFASQAVRFWGKLPSSSRRCSSYGSLRDRKSTRLNSSHVSISYAVFCLKKKNKTHK